VADVFDYAGAGVGVAGAGYGAYEWWKSDQVRSDWARVGADAKKLKDLVTQYTNGVNEIIAKFNTSFSSGNPVDSADVSMEEAEVADLEKQINEIIIQIFHDIDTTKTATKLSTWAFIEGIMSDVDPALCTLKKIALGGLGLYFTGKVVLPAGYGIYKFIKKIQDDHNDMNRPSGTSGTNPVTGKVISGATSEEFQINMQRDLQVNCVVDLATTLTLVPVAQSQFAALPEWVQKQLAVEAGITEWYSQPAQQWGFHISANPRTICAIIAAVTLAVAIGIVLGPEILPLLQEFGATLASGMAGAAA
jgi:hypothetical protein